MAVRRKVFIEEQNVPAELEMDGKDASCQHVKAINEAGIVIGTARLLPSSYVGRMCVLKAFRHQGAGAKMLSWFIEHANRHHYKILKLNAQLSAVTFYQQFGFIKDSDVFMEADIEHVHMTLCLAN